MSDFQNTTHEQQLAEGFFVIEAEDRLEMVQPIGAATSSFCADTTNY